MRLRGSKLRPHRLQEVGPAIAPRTEFRVIRLARAPQGCAGGAAGRGRGERAAHAQPAPPPHPPPPAAARAMRRALAPLPAAAPARPGAQLAGGVGREGAERSLSASWPIPATLGGGRSWEGGGGTLTVGGGPRRALRRTPLFCVPLGGGGRARCAPPFCPFPLCPHLPGPARNWRDAQCRRRPALCDAPHAAPLFPAPVGGDPRPRARRRQGAGLGVCHAPALALAAGAGPAGGAARP